MNLKSSTRRKLSATDSRNLRTLLLLSVFDGPQIGQRIAQARREVGLNQEELADLMGVSTRSLQGYEAGDVIPYRHFERLSGIVRKPVEWLLHGDQPAAEPATVEEIRQVRADVAELRAKADQMLEILLGPGDSRAQPKHH